jgi:hypothetical protein
VLTWAGSWSRCEICEPSTFAAGRPGNLGERPPKAHRAVTDHQLGVAQRAGCPLSALTAQLDVARPATQAIITRLYDRWLGQLTVGVRALQDSGEADPRLDADEAATAILTAVTGGATLLQATDSLTYLDASLTQAIDALRPR